MITNEALMDSGPGNVDDGSNGETGADTGGNVDDGSN